MALFFFEYVFVFKIKPDVSEVSHLFLQISCQIVKVFDVTETFKNFLISKFRLLFKFVKNSNHLSPDGRVNDSAEGDGIQACNRTCDNNCSGSFEVQKSRPY